MYRLLAVNAFTALVYFGLFALQLQSMNAELYGVSFIFLPHGWRVLSFFLFRFSAMPGLFFGHLLTCLVFYGSVSDNWHLYLVTSFQGAYTLPIIYFVLTLSGVDLLKKRKDYPVVPWTSIVFLTVFATLFNGPLLELANAVYFDLPPNWIEVQQYMVGDMIGALLCIAGLLLFFRWQRLRTEQKRIAD